MKQVAYAERIQILRKEEGITQTQLAQSIGVSQSAIVLWEAGSRVPNANAIIALAKYFDVTTDYLLGLSDE